MRKAAFIFGAVCLVVPLLWLGVMFAVSRADPASATNITVRVPGVSEVQSNITMRSVSSFIDAELLRNGFGRDRETHGLDGTSWVTVYSYRGKHYPPKTDVLSSGCEVHEGSNEVRVVLSELGVSRPTQQFDKIRHALKDALIKEYGTHAVN
jgi:hypothetical protein